MILVKSDKFDKMEGVGKIIKSKIKQKSLIVREYGTQYYMWSDF